MIDMHSPLETVPVDGGQPIRLDPNRRYWPNPVSMEYCASMRAPGADHAEEHWYDDEGQPVEQGSPAIRNVATITSIDVRDAFFAGAGIATNEEKQRRFKVWQKVRDERLQ